MKLKKEIASRKQLHNQIEDMKGKVRVYCRIRPLLKSEVEKNNSNIILNKDEFGLSIKNK